MDNVIDFALERAKRKSGIKDTVLLKDVIDEGYDPCNDLDMTNYFEWKKFQDIIIDDKDISHNWTDEAIQRLWNDITNIDTSKTYTVEYSVDDLIAGDDFNLDFTTKPPKNT